MKSVSMVACTLLCCGCYTTKTYTRGRPEYASAPVHKSHQVFTLGGLAPVSKPSGIKCKHGLSVVESSLSAVDWLLTGFLVVAGAVIGSRVCPVLERPGKRVACMAGVGGGPAFMVSTRTIKYGCSHPVNPRQPPARNALPAASATDSCRPTPPRLR